MNEVERLGRPAIGSAKRGPSPLLSTRVEPSTLTKLTELGRATGQRPSQLLREAIDLLLEKHSDLTSGATRSAVSTTTSRPIPEHLDELRGPSSGTVTRPSSVATSASSVFNVDNRFDRAALYQLVVSEASRDDLAAYLNRDLLISDWSRLNLATDVRAAWEARFPELSGSVQRI